MVLMHNFPGADLSLSSSQTPASRTYGTAASETAKLCQEGFSVKSDRGKKLREKNGTDNELRKYEQEA